MDHSTQAPRAASALIVDDSAPQREHAAGLCRELGFSIVHEAANGQAALELLASLPQLPRLMIVDLEMPHMDGVELLEEMRARHISVPVVLASAREATLIEAVQAMQHCVVTGLQKPLDRSRLEVALDLSAKAPGHVPERRRPQRFAIDARMLEAAIREGTIEAHFQPKIDLRSGLLRGVEALARWTHPRLGMVPPDQFVPLAERAGLIHDLTLSIMNQSFAQCAGWARRGLDISVAINLSPALLDRNLVSQVCDLADRHGVPPAKVVLEVTESFALEASGAAPSALARLRLKGFGLSIDDYGTGFSSLQQLARIPFTELKIDRSFVHRAHERKNQRVILESALELAQRLELLTVAEGVETLEDWQLLQRFGCSAAQGWLIAKAMPGDAILPWLKTENPRLRSLRAPNAVAP